MATIVIGSIPAGQFALADTLGALPDVEFESERIIKSGEGAVMPLLWVRNADRDELEAAFDDDPTVANVSLIAEFDDELLYRMDWVDQIHLLLQMITHSEATVLEAYGRDDVWRVRVLFPARDGFSDTHDFCNEHGLEFDVESIRELEGQPAGRYGLTEGQYEALVLAARNGYYDVPQEQTLEELAEDLDVSHQALSERLRRGTESLIEDTLLVGAPPDLR